jgi:hypothetical protein
MKTKINNYIIIFIILVLLSIYICMNYNIDNITEHLTDDITSDTTSDTTSESTSTDYLNIFTDKPEVSDKSSKLFFDSTDDIGSNTDTLMKSFSDTIGGYNEFYIKDLPNYNNEYKIPTYKLTAEITPNEFIDLLNKFPKKKIDEYGTLILLSKTNDTKITTNNTNQIDSDFEDPADYNKALSDLNNPNYDSNDSTKSVSGSIDNVTNDINDTNDTELINLFEINRDTWINRTGGYDPNKRIHYSTIKSKYNNVNDILYNFLLKLNSYNKNAKASQERIKKYGFEPFFIYKYKIMKIEKTNNSSVILHIIAVVFKNTSLFANVVYINGLVDRNNNTVIYFDVRNIGQYTTDTLLLTKGSNQDIIGNNVYAYNYNIEKQNLYTDDEVKIILDKKLGTFETKLEDQYICFNITRDPNKLLLRFPDRKSCENKYSLYGGDKEYGVWDKPCRNNTECTLYNGNKNYKNDFGKCNNGYCELPLNMKPLGYHHYSTDIKDKPLCYNCTSTEWKPMTNLDTCCIEQQDRKKYPFLKSPDYAFKDDKQIRLNYKK